MREAAKAAHNVGDRRHVTVMRGSSSCAAGVPEMAATSGLPAGRAEAGRAAGAENSPGAALDQARNGRSAPNAIRISFAFWSMLYSLTASSSSTTRTTCAEYWPMRTLRTPPRFTPSYSPSARLSRVVPVRSMTRRAGSLRTKSSSWTAPEMAMTTSARPGAETTLTPVTDPGSETSARTARPAP